MIPKKLKLFRNYQWYLCSQNANIKESSWLLRESRMCVFSKEAMRNVKSWLIGKDSDAGRDWGQEEKGTTQDEMAGWHHWLDGLDVSLSELREMVMDREAWCAMIHGVAKSRTRLSDWTELICKIINPHLWNNTGNSTQYCAIIYMGKESEKE